MNAKDADVVTPGAAPLVPELMRLVKADHPFDGLLPPGSSPCLFPEFFP